MLGMLLVLGVSRTDAQIINWTDRGFVNVNGGYQTQSRDFETTQTFRLYNETATVKAGYEIGAGALFDISGGVRVGPNGGIWRNVGVGIGYSRFKNTDDLTVEATLPHPVFFDRPRTVTTTANDLEHTESAVHIFGLWMLPLSDKMDVAVFLGPTIFSIKQDLVTGVQIAQPEQSPFTGAITGIVQAKAKKTGVGVNVGADWSYMVTPQFGGGVFLRYAGGSVKLEAEDLSVDLNVGGFQFGAGLRVRFQKLFP